VSAGLGERRWRLTEAERRRLHETFESLCRIESPTGEERACADWITRELREFGLEVTEDQAAAAAGTGAGNLLARIPGRSDSHVMLGAHMDTVPLAAPVRPVFRDGGWENENDGILGADNKAAVAALIELARLVAAPDTPPEVGLELVFTVCEETGLHGAKAFDVGALRSGFGYVFDHASPLGEFVAASATYQRLTAEIRGRAAHAGLHPERGRSAIAAAARAISGMQLGRLDPETTANIGLIAGGTAVNVVPERCRLVGEVRGVDPARVEEVLTGMIDLLQDAADGGECDLDVAVERMFAGYRIRPGAPALVLAERALRACGYEPRPITTGGGSDANAFQAAGFSCVNLANGTERAHEPSERVSAVALEGGLELALALVEHAASTLEAIAA
jgi:tripeptide aminopeptidase